MAKELHYSRIAVVFVIATRIIGVQCCTVQCVCVGAFQRTDVHVLCARVQGQS